MKYFAILLCFYFNALTILPTVRALKVHFTEKQQMSCNSSKSEKEPVKSCEKEKCLLSYSLNSPTFLVFISSYTFTNTLILTSKKETTLYHKNFISNYIEIIWQPPESFLLT